MSYFKKDKLLIFPSSNISNDSKVTTEDNIAGIIRALGLENHVVNGLTLTKSGTNINISAGSGLVNGYVFVTDESIAVPIESDGTYNIIFRLYYDVDNHIIGEDVEDYIEGFVAEAIDASTALTADMILLGNITRNSGTITINNQNPYRHVVLDGGSWD